MIPKDPKNFNKEQKQSLNQTIILVLVLINAIIIKFAFVGNAKNYLLLAITIPLLLAAVIYYNQQKRVIRHPHPANEWPGEEEYLEKSMN
jgi:hypothetical protein